MMSITNRQSVPSYRKVSTTVRYSHSGVCTSSATTAMFMLLDSSNKSVNKNKLKKLCSPVQRSSKTVASNDTTTGEEIRDFNWRRHKGLQLAQI